MKLGFVAFSVGQTLIMHSCVHYMTHVIKYYINIAYKKRGLGCIRESLAPYLSEGHNVLNVLALIHAVKIPVTVLPFPEFCCVSDAQLLSNQVRILKCEGFRGLYLSVNTS